MRVQNDVVPPALVRQVAQTYPALDPGRILCTGMSDGGTFSYLLSMLCPRPPGAVKRPWRSLAFSIETIFLWRFCMGAQGA